MQTTAPPLALRRFWPWLFAAGLCLFVIVLIGAFFDSIIGLEATHYALRGAAAAAVSPAAAAPAPSTARYKLHDRDQALVTRSNGLHP